MVLTFAVGLTVILKVIGTPIQLLLYLGVTVILAVTGELLLLVAVKAGMLEVVPAAAIPMPGWSFVQL